MQKIIIYTDGSSRGNPGPGGWGAIIIEERSTSNEPRIKEIGGREEKTTNNRMEMKAAINALRTLGQARGDNGAVVEIYTDSSYLLNGITRWVRGWQANGWKTKEKGEVLNRDLWEELIGETAKRDVEWKKVSGHSGHALNERCDEIARTFADGKEMELYNGPQEKYQVKAASSRHLGNANKNTKAYSYISMVNKVIQVHQTWGECKARVDGVKGARFRKAVSPDDEKNIIALFQRE